MRISDWNKRWENQQIGFHEHRVNHYLTQHIKQFNLTPQASIFVPLCGKSHDLKWLSDQGYQVIGIECSAIAVTDFFKQHNLTPTIESIDHFTVYRCGNMTLYQGDFYHLNLSHLPKCDLIYDRASMVAFTQQDRPQYVKHLSQWFSPNTQMLLVTLSYDQNTMSGPPFSVNNSEVENAYQHKNIKTLTVNNVIDEGPRWRKVGLTSLVETAFIIY